MSLKSFSSVLSLILPVLCPKQSSAPKGHSVPTPQYSNGQPRSRDQQAPTISLPEAPWSVENSKVIWDGLGAEQISTRKLCTPGKALHIVQEAPLARLFNEASETPPLLIVPLTTIRIGEPSNNEESITSSSSH